MNSLAYGLMFIAMGITPFIWFATWTPKERNSLEGQFFCVMSIYPMTAIIFGFYGIYCHFNP